MRRNCNSKKLLIMDNLKCYSLTPNHYLPHSSHVSTMKLSPSGAHSKTVSGVLQIQKMRSFLNAVLAVIKPRILKTSDCLKYQFRPEKNVNMWRCSEFNFYWSYFMEKPFDHFFRYVSKFAHVIHEPKKK